MKRLSFLLLMIFGFIFVSNCQSQIDSLLVQKNGKALIVVIRPYKMMGWPYNYPFGVDNKIFCVLSNKTFGYTYIDSGKHMINGSKFIDGSYELTISQDKTFNLDLNSDHSDQMMSDKSFEVSKIYYYRVIIGLGNISSYARLEEINEKDAKKLLKNVSVSQKNKTQL